MGSSSNLPHGPKTSGSVQQPEVTTTSGKPKNISDEWEAIHRERDVVQKAPWNKMPTDTDRKACGADDGSTVCILPVGHPIGHKSKSGRVWI